MTRHGGKSIFRMKLFSAEPVFSGNDAFGCRIQMKLKTIMLIARIAVSIYAIQKTTELKEILIYSDKNTLTSHKRPPAESSAGGFAASL